ncbi:MAG: S8 family serine peptidase [Candidatus Omnitrophota bacterium]
MGKNRFRQMIMVLILGLVIIGVTTLQARGLVKEEELTATGEQSVDPLDIRGQHSGSGILKPEYAPGEIIVKFKDEAGQVLNKKLTPVDLSLSTTATGISSIDNLNYKHKVKKIAPVFKALKKKMMSTGMSMTAYNEEIKAKFPKRAARAPKDKKVPNLTNIYKLTMEDKDANILAICEQYKKDPNVEYAEPNYIAMIQMVPNDPYYSSSGAWGQDYDDLWGLKQDKLNCEPAWDIAQGEGVVVAVIDTGIDYNHEDIAANIWINPGEILGNGIDDDGNGFIDDCYGYDFAYGDNDPQDGHGHGTHCAGTIAAIGNNAKGVIGVAPNAKAMAVKGLDDGGSGYESSLANALRYAADNGADVISNSWGGAADFQLITEVLDYAYNIGCVLVAAAGNSNDEVSYYSPANHNKVITVAATDHNDQKADFSNYGLKIDVAAPGGDSWSDDINRTYANILSLRASNTDMYGDGKNVVDTNYYRVRGTSMACPHVAGAAALILSKHPEFNAEQVRQVLRTSADDVGAPGWDEDSGYGRLNAYRALQTDTACVAKITSPLTNINVGELTDNWVLSITGSAYGTGFQSYRVEYGVGEIPTSWITLGSFSTPVENGDLLLPWDTHGLLGDYIIRLVVTDNLGNQFEDRVLIRINNIHYQAGWPVQASDIIVEANPVVADLDHDGRMEVITSVFSRLEVFDYQGHPLPGWPVDIVTDINALSVIPSIADIDPNYPGDEIIVYYSATVHVFHMDGTEFINGKWPQAVTGGSSYNLFQTVVVADINQDSQPEVIFSNRDRLYVWDREGNLYSNQWPKNLGQIISAPPAVGNIDNDPELEIVIATYQGYLYVFNPDGSEVWSKLVKEGALLQKPVLADIDNDSQNEIIIKQSKFIDGSGYYIDEHLFYAFNGDGSLVEGSWPIETTSANFCPYSYPAVADLDNDGYLDIIDTTDTQVIAFNHLGQPLTGWPREVAVPLPNPVIGDIDGDGDLEVMVTAFYSKSIYAWHHDGTRIAGYPIAIGGTLWALQTCALGDLDGDNDVEVIASNYDGKIFALDHNNEGAVEKTYFPWPQFCHDPQHTGCYPSPMVNSLSRSGGYITTKVTITGQNFGSNQGTSRVTFNGIAVTDYLSWSDSEIQVKVPVGATSGQVIVETPTGRSYANCVFTVWQAVGQYLLADINRDGAVNMPDLYIFMDNYQKSPLNDPRADLNGDNEVNTIDEILLSIDFGKQGMLIADINKDGQVNIADFGVIARFLSQGAAAKPEADINRDGTIDYDDFEIVKVDYHKMTVHIERYLPHTDLNRDGEVDEKDRQIVIDGFLPWADVNGDGVINEWDVNLVERDME